MQSAQPHIVILGTGGTIAGAADAAELAGYKAGVLGVEALVKAVPALAQGPHRLEAEQVAQINSKDMNGLLWQRLAERVAHHLERAEVAGIVVTHGTDTLEETAWLLQRVLAPRKPVVLTASMHPATSLQADGPQNLLDAATLAGWPGAHGVCVAVAGQVYSAFDVRKSSTWRLDAFSGGDAGPIGYLQGGSYRAVRAWPEGKAMGLGILPRDDAPWPWVEVVASGALASGAAVKALVDAGVQGLVAAGTGNGTFHEQLREALLVARQRGVAVVRSSRCATGGVVGADDPLLPAWTGMFPGMTTAQARVELMLRLLAGIEIEAGDAR